MTDGPGLTLVPLDCPSCGASVAAHGADVVYYCTACRNGYRFDDESRSLIPVEVAFLSLPDRAVERYLPFWLQPATVTMAERKAQGDVFRGLMSFFLGGDRTSPSGEGVFAVPAFDAPLDAVVRLTHAYTEALPRLGEKLGERLVGGCYGFDEIRKLAHFTLVATEVDKPDLLKDLSYTIDFGEPRLLGVGFVRARDGWADAVFGIEVPEPAAA
ncbi:MAG: hypothetical protein R3325_14640, partial [Thermoanaerobaculia bacterium]|nr:hypothetical protein [Thermoanaerobaculia bacterium]